MPVLYLTEQGATLRKEGDLTPKQMQRLRQRLEKVLKAPDDNLRYYFLCSGCIYKIMIINGPEVYKVQLYFVV